MTCATRDVTTTRADPTARTAGRTAIRIAGLITVWIARGVMAAGGQTIIPVTGMAGHISIATALTRAAITTGVHTDTHQPDTTTTPILV